MCVYVCLCVHACVHAVLWTRAALCRYGVKVVHAGLVPGIPLEQQQPAHLTKMRELLRADVASTSALLTGCGLGGRGMCSAKT